MGLQTVQTLLECYRRESRTHECSGVAEVRQLVLSASDGQAALVHLA